METYPYVLCPWEVCWRLGSPAYMRRLWPEGISTLSCSLWMCGGWMLFGALWAGKGDCREDPVHITSIAHKEGSQGHLLSSKLFWLKHVGLRLGGLLEYVFIGLSGLVYRFIEFGLSVYRVWFIGLSGYRFIGLSGMGISVYRLYHAGIYIYICFVHILQDPGFAKLADLRQVVQELSQWSSKGASIYKAFGLHAACF